MKAGMEYAVIPMQCDLCSYKWIAVVEVEMIEIVEKEHKISDTLDCPNCNNKTKTAPATDTGEDGK